MKKNKIIIGIITTSIILLFYTVGKAQNNAIKTKTDLSELKLKGKVKSLNETKYIAVDKFGVIKKTDFIDKNITLFNVKGNMIEETNYNSDGSIDSKFIYKYDDKGNEIESNVFNGNMSYKETYKYDDKGNKIEGNRYNSDGSLIYKCIYKYDDKGNKIEETNYNSDGSIDSKFIYKYDDKGNEIEMNQYKTDGSLWNKITLKYDDKGNKIELNMHDPVGSMDVKEFYKYDDKGNMIELNTYNSDGELISDKETYKYDYDKTGNWIKQTEFINGIPDNIIEREIEYYTE